jgi:hypothetical protein
MNNTEFRPLPIKLQEFQKIVKHLKNISNINLDDNIFILAKNIRNHIISLDINNKLSVYDITYRCIRYINDFYMNKQEEP